VEPCWFVAVSSICQVPVSVGVPERVAGPTRSSSTPSGNVSGAPSAPVAVSVGVGSPATANVCVNDSPSGVVNVAGAVRAGGDSTVTVMGSVVWEPTAFCAVTVNVVDPESPAPGVPTSVGTPSSSTTESQVGAPLRATAGAGEPPTVSGTATA